MEKYIKMALKWLAATGTGVLTVAGAYVLDQLAALPIDLGTTQGIVLLLVVTGATKLVTWLVAKIPAPAPEEPPA